MELTQEGKEIIRKRDRSSSVEPGGQHQNKITKPLQGEKRDLQGTDSSDPEPPRKETRPVRKKARQVALDRALAQKMQDDAFALVADSSSESDLNQSVQSSVEEGQSASIDVLVQQRSPVPQKNALARGLQRRRSARPSPSAGFGSQHHNQAIHRKKRAENNARIFNPVVPS